MAGGTNQSSSLSRKDAARNKAVLEARLLQIKLQEQNGTLCRADDVRETFAAAIMAVKHTLDALSPKLAEAFAVEFRLDEAGMHKAVRVATGVVETARIQLVEEWKRIGEARCTAGWDGPAAPAEPGQEASA